MTADPATADVDRGNVARGTTIMGFTVLLALLTSLATEAAGLKYVQNIIWPTDLLAFANLDKGPIDVVIFGSSRATFGFSTSVIDECLERTLGRPTRTVNLARVYSTSLSWQTLARDLLDGERVPRVLLVGVETESVNSHHHYSEAMFEAEASVRDVPDLARSAFGWTTLAAAFSPIGRGPLALALVPSGRFDNEDRLRWMMVNEDGGQFCFDYPACDTQNRSFMQVSSDRWERFRLYRDFIVTDQRFTDYVIGEGLSHRRLMGLLEWARDNDVTLLLVNMPMHAWFQEKIPTEVYAAYSEYVSRWAAEWGVTVYDANVGDWRNDTSWFVDPDHLNQRGAYEMSRTVCEEAIAPILAATTR